MVKNLWGREEAKDATQRALFTEMCHNFRIWDYVGKGMECVSISFPIYHLSHSNHEAHDFLLKTRQYAPQNMLTQIPILLDYSEFYENQQF